jgi:alpha-galactosidase
MGKITFMGAGSTVFAKNVLGDSMMTEALRDFELSLYDIDQKRLDESYIMIDSLNRNINEGRAKVTKHLGVENRKEALHGADFVVDAIQVGGYDPCTITDFEIPKKYGLRQTIADTLGIGGIFRALRTIPYLKALPRTWRRSARTHFSSTTQTRWQCCRVTCRDTPESRPSASATAFRSARATSLKSSV